mmetsp:Transcript_23038/g.20002  ORF Transcript_23038/g.20002 Transcript_23038/m.20002 type:complete len:241 (+) Transcript_23038:82-804(+)|eukprot:CAMPEP_0114589344 /NCGR_PEP_ID=MMETSP0125-20121206/11808_1 /TAXON_ID=485358 ORGANISM="Aristerostoma sp., Strain ATCC 50986" /NCGR_SAMPLE_ID=MMETSP0125 /ASSEMBLY_ACC=CAM_ASM_000245 /LENGTH=240 /DNA_ID=CAMNT_0001786169 /DNA_START=79 /DNA_END=801 /DNA_ORIENTATION=-
MNAIKNNIESNQDGNPCNYKNIPGLFRERACKSIFEFIDITKAEPTQEDAAEKFNSIKEEIDKSRLKYCYEFLVGISKSDYDLLVNFLKEYRKEYEKKWKNHKTWNKLMELCDCYEGGNIFFKFLEQFVGDEGEEDFCHWLVTYSGKQNMVSELYKKRKNGGLLAMLHSMWNKYLVKRGKRGEIVEEKKVEEQKPPKPNTQPKPVKKKKLNPLPPDEIQVKIEDHGHPTSKVNKVKFDGP